MFVGNGMILLPFHKSTLLISFTSRVCLSRWFHLIKIGSFTSVYPLLVYVAITYAANKTSNSHLHSLIFSVLSLPFCNCPVVVLGRLRVTQNLLPYMSSCFFVFIATVFLLLLLRMSGYKMQSQFSPKLML